MKLLQRLQFRLQQQHPQSQLNIQQKMMQQLLHRLHLALSTFVDKKQQKMTALCRRLDNSPLPLLCANSTKFWFNWSFV